MKTDLLTDDLKDLVANNPRDVVIVLAAGVTIGALRGSRYDAQASWRGLLESGIDWGLGLATIKPDDAARLRGMLESDNAEFWILAAEAITTALGGPSGGELKKWLRATVGGFVGEIRDRTVVDALKELSDQGVLLATVNYDGILEAVTGLGPVTWRKPSQVERVLRGDERGILHLHGHWEDPLSLVFGVRSYEDVVHDEHAREVLRSMRMQKTLVFVGHGAGLADPNWGSFLRWTERIFAGAEYRHFRLVREDERERVQAEHPPAQRIFALSYGARHGDLGPFLRSLVPVAGAGSAPMVGASASSRAELSPTPSAPVKTVLVLVNIGDRDHHWLQEDAARALIGAPDAICYKAEEVIDRRSVSARQWRAIAQRLDAVVKEADAVVGPVEYVVAGVAPLPAFAYLGQMMRRMRGPIRFVNRRQGSNIVDVVGPLDAIAKGGRDRFAATQPSKLRLGRVVLSIQCSRGYAYSDESVKAMIESEGESIHSAYEIRDAERSKDSEPMIPEELPPLLDHVDEALEWYGRDCRDSIGLALAIGGPSWVAFWVAFRLNSNVCGPRIDFPSFVPSAGYVRALASPMHLAPWLTGKAKLLFMTAEPEREDRVRGSKAADAIQTAIENELGRRGPYEIRVCGAISVEAFMREVELFKPDILHLHLHGSPDGHLCFENDRGDPQVVSGDHFIDMLKVAGAEPALIVLSACHSAVLADRLLGIAECVISMTTEVKYETTIRFAKFFYAALARGRSLAAAIKGGQLMTPAGYDTIRPLTAPGLNADEIVLFPKQSKA